MPGQWWEPLGRDGEVHLLDRTDLLVKRRVLGTGDGGPLEASVVSLPEASVIIRIDKGLCEAVADESVVASLRVDGGGGGHVGGSVLGADLSMGREADKSRGSLIRGPLMYWALSAGEHSWVWHFEDCSDANDRILSAGSRPGDVPLVVTSAAAVTAQEQQEQMAKRHLVGRFDARARPIDVVLAELVDIAGLGDMVRTRLIRGTYAAMDLGMWWFKDQPL